MKQVAFIWFAIYILFLNQCSMGLSQNRQQCNDVINFNDIVNFDTTAMYCLTVWRDSDYVFRVSSLILIPCPNLSRGFQVGENCYFLRSIILAIDGDIFPHKCYYRLQVYQNGGSTLAVERTSMRFHFLERECSSCYSLPPMPRSFLAFQLSTSEPRRELLYAVGPYGQLPTSRNGFRLVRHRDQASASLDYSTGRSETISSPYTGIRRTHGALNMIGWGILMPIGVIVARYFKQWDPIWFYSHAAIQIFSFLFGLIGFILGFVVQGFINAEVTHHKNLGIVILIFGCLQVMALLIRPKKGTKPRKYWNWYHNNAGRILVILAISNIFYGIRLGMEGSSWYGTYAVIVVLMFIVAVILEIRLWRQR